MLQLCTSLISTQRYSCCQWVPSACYDVIIIVMQVTSNPASAPASPGGVATAAGATSDVDLAAAGERAYNSLLGKPPNVLMAAAHGAALAAAGVLMVWSRDPM
jgi:hypothetical protein